MHSGHFNAIRQGKKLSPWLIVGANTDEALMVAKGPTILKHHERHQIISAVKWTDETFYDCPYDCDIELLDKLNCRYYIHGDDPVYNKDGECYTDILKGKGRLMEIKRTTGISTTDITAKLLDLLKPEKEEEQVTNSKKFADPPKQSFLQTATRIARFSNRSEPKPSDRVVYFAASCDLMHPGVIEKLKLAKAQGDYLYVGLWDDETIRYYKGGKYPLQGLQERILMALAIKYVDDVVIGAPYVITEDFLLSLGIKKVVHVITDEDQVKPEHRHVDPYSIPKEQKIYVELPKIANDITLQQIAKRVENNRAAFEKKVAKKLQSQAKYYESKKSKSVSSSTACTSPANVQKIKNDDSNQEGSPTSITENQASYEVEQSQSMTSASCAIF